MPAKKFDKRTDSLLAHCIARAVIHDQGGIEEATRKYGPKAERLSKWKAMKSVAKVTNKASRVASFMVMWAVAMLDEGVEDYTITQYQRYWNEGERQVNRLQREFRELWPEFETPNEFAAQMKGQLDPSMSKVDVAMLPTRLQVTV